MNRLILRAFRTLETRERERKSKLGKLQTLEYRLVYGEKENFINIPAIGSESSFHPNARG